MQKEFEKAEWYYEKNEVSVGPITKIELIELINRKEISKENLVWKNGMQDWICVGKVEELVLNISNDFIPPPLPFKQTAKNTTTPSTNPNTLNENKKKDTTSKIPWWQIIFFGTILIIGYFVINEGPRGNIKYTPEPTLKPVVSIGDVLTTDFFKIQLNEVYSTTIIETGNEYSDIIAQRGNVFLVLDITFKNISNESRLFGVGALHVKYNGQELLYDHQEGILAEGWMSFLDEINPLTTHHTKVVYKIPSELFGSVQWMPDRNSDRNYFQFTIKKK